MYYKLTVDIECGALNLLPGDVVETPNGSLAVVIKAQTTINGSVYDWNDFPININIEHGHLPGYSIESLPGYDIEKNAWWIFSEFKGVVALSPLHNLINKN